MIKTAILIDGAFYRKRAYHIYGDKTPAERAKELSTYCHRHIVEEKEGASLYRVFYYVLALTYPLWHLKNRLIALS